LVGCAWIGLLVERRENHARDVWTRHHIDRLRTKDVEEAVRVYRAVAADIDIEVRITPDGRIRGRGLEFAVELSKRGVPVAFDSISERGDEFAWVDEDNTGERLNTNFNLPPVRLAKGILARVMVPLAVNTWAFKGCRVA
jgi:hypothetical protein